MTRQNSYFPRLLHRDK